MHVLRRRKLGKSQQRSSLHQFYYYHCACGRGAFLAPSTAPAGELLNSCTRANLHLAAESPKKTSNTPENKQGGAGRESRQNRAQGCRQVHREVERFSLSVKEETLLCSAIETAVRKAIDTAVRVIRHTVSDRSDHARCTFLPRHK